MPKRPRSYATLPDAELDRLAAHGDSRARAERTARQQVHRLASQADAPPDPGDWIGAWSLAEGCYAHYLTDDLLVQFRRDAPGRVSLWVRIDAHTTHTQWRDAWGDIEVWRDRLTAWQPPDAGRDRYLLDLHRDQQRTSYGAVARRLNAEIARYLTEFWAHWRAEPEAPRVRAGHLWFLGRAAAWPMEAVGLAPDEIAMWLRDGVHNLRDGHPPFPPEAPITPARVRDALRHWRARHPEWLTPSP